MKEYGNQGRKAIYVTAICYCGVEFDSRLDNLKSGNTKGCGCVKRTHLLSKHRLYPMWRTMRNRCFNKNSKYYKDYGARGISISTDWLNVQKFIVDMFPTYREGLTLERKNNAEGYCKENCIWVTMKEQGLNKRNNIKYKGECASEASRRLGGCPHLVRARLKLGWSKEKAFTLPLAVYSSQSNKRKP